MSAKIIEYNKNIGAADTSGFILKFSELLNINPNELVKNPPSYFEQVDYTNGNIGNVGDLRGQFFKHWNISVNRPAVEQQSNTKGIFLKNTSDTVPHFTMTEATYQTYKTQIDELGLIIFIVEEGAEYGDKDEPSIYHEADDKRTQHLIQYLQKLQGN